MDPALVKVDSYLRDEKLYRLIKKDLSKRWPKTKETGRNSTPGEVILRMLVVKRLYGYSYEETERNVSDSLNLRRFCRVYLHRVPDDTTLMRWANLIQPQTLAKFNPATGYRAEGNEGTEAADGWDRGGKQHSSSQ
jgi:IS5 family transposase